MLTETTIPQGKAAEPEPPAEFHDADRASRHYTLTYEGASVRGWAMAIECIGLDVLHACSVVEKRLEAKFGAGVLGEMRLMRVADARISDLSWTVLQRSESADERAARRCVWQIRQAVQS